MTHPPRSLPHRLRKTTTTLVAFEFTLAGLLIMLLTRWLAGLELGAWSWLHNAPLGEIGGALFSAGVISTWLDYRSRKQQDLVNGEMIDKAVKKAVPTMRDAVIEAFDLDPENLKRVATPEMLDRLASNAMALRLGDEQFAHEVYRDIRDQAIRAAERWHDVQVRIRLSGIPERSTVGAPLFDVTVEWEYTTIPSHPIRKFACVSDRDEFNELTSEIPSTLTWFMRRRPGMDASKRECYELLSFTVDGHARPVRRAGRKTGQTYSVNIGEDVVAAGKAVRVRHIYRTVVSGAGHRLFVSLPQPAKDLAVHFDYSDTNIARLSVTDLFPSARPVQIDYLPEELPGKMVMATIPGWSLPRTGLVYVWTLSSEELSAGETTASRVA